MSMSTHVEAFKPADDKWRAMKAVYDACAQAKITTPSVVDEFFENDYPDEAGVRVNIEDMSCCKKYDTKSGTGVEIDVRLLPKDVTIIRFINRW